MILHTIDGGVSWEIAASGMTSRHLYTIFAENINNVYFGGAYGTFFKYYSIPASVDENGDVNISKNTEVIIYPNPFNSECNINIKHYNSNYSIVIYDIKGNIIEYIKDASSELNKLRWKPNDGANSGVYC